MSVELWPLRNASTPAGRPDLPAGPLRQGGAGRHHAPVSVRESPGFGGFLAFRVSSGTSHGLGKTASDAILSENGRHLTKTTGFPERRRRGPGRARGPLRPAARGRGPQPRLWSRAGQRHARATPIPLTRPAVLLIIGSWMEWAKGLMRTPAAKADTPLADGGFAPSEIELTPLSTTLSFLLRGGCPEDIAASAGA